MKPTKLTFEQTERDTQTGCATWSIKLDGELVGQIDKDTDWCGDGYRASSYSVTIELPEDDDSADECFDVANTWSRGRGMTARAALAACKAFAREHVRKTRGNR